MADPDYVIVGAGSPGCVLANRLREDPGTRVLLIEAGGKDRHPNIKIPAACANQFHAELDWEYWTEPEPAVLLFATPALCQSRVCGPVVDVEAQVKRDRPDDAKFIHMEIWNDNDPNKGAREQVLDYNLKSEPWLFVVNSDGTISTRIEGAFSVNELNEALDKAH